MVNPMKVVSRVGRSIISLCREVRDAFRKPDPVEQLRMNLEDYGCTVRTSSPEETIGYIGVKQKRLVRRFAYIGTVESTHYLGLIEILDCPIRWANVVRYQGYDGPADFAYTLLVPDDRLRGVLHVRIRTAVRRNFPAIGLATSLRWVSDPDTAAAENLNRLSDLNEDFVEEINAGTGSQIAIETEEIIGHWLLTMSEMPSLEMWDGCVTIAQELLASPIGDLKTQRPEAARTVEQHRKSRRR
jgi:hypothetical protein